jgi:hypothetical protein
VPYSYKEGEAALLLAMEHTIRLAEGDISARTLVDRVSRDELVLIRQQTPHWVREHLFGGKRFTPPGCPACRQPFDSAIPANLDAIHEAYRAMPEGVRPAVSFRVPHPGEEPTP